LGRIKTVKSCYVWTSAIETILRWAGLANDWYVEEVECGSVTGTFDCAFAIRSAETIKLGAWAPASQREGPPPGGRGPSERREGELAVRPYYPRRRKARAPDFASSSRVFRCVSRST